MSTVSNNNNKTTATATVRLNVGGTKYEVSRSLIEQYPNTMLARLISEEWDQEKAGKELFIERNGKCFEFVLNCMRDQKVTLPVNAVSKDALLQELEYFGFNDVSPDAINTTLATMDIVAHRKYLHIQYKIKIDQYKIEIAHYKIKIHQGYMHTACVKIAYMAHTKQLENHAVKFCFQLDENEFSQDEWNFVETSGAEFKAALTEHMDAYGLRFSNLATNEWDRSRYEIEVSAKNQV